MLLQLLIMSLAIPLYTMNIVLYLLALLARCVLFSRIGIWFVILPLSLLSMQLSFLAIPQIGFLPFKIMISSSLLLSMIFLLVGPFLATLLINYFDPLFFDRSIRGLRLISNSKENQNVN